jgi:hypothetical protein
VSPSFNIKSRRPGMRFVSLMNKMRKILRLLLFALIPLSCGQKEFGMPNPNNIDPWVVLTDFSSDETWLLVRNQVTAPQKDPMSGMKFTANVKCLSDSANADVNFKDLVRTLPDDYPGFLVFVVDETTIKHQEHPVLVVGFSPESTDPKEYERKPSQTPNKQIKSFRALPALIQCIENNLSIANMDFDDFANSVDDDNIFRGFPK